MSKFTLTTLGKISASFLVDIVRGYYLNLLIVVISPSSKVVFGL